MHCEHSIGRPLMTLTAPQDVRATRPSAGRLSDRGAFALLISMGVSYLAGSSAPTPLYSRYQAAWGFSPMTTTVVFGVYALAVLVALLVAGSLSDHVGRRPVLITATLVLAATMVVFATADGVTELLLARVLQGLATGAALGAVGAGLLDLDRSRGALANAVATPIGTASGAIGAGLLVQFLPAPTHLVYLVLLAVYLLQALGAVLMRETVTPRPGAVASLKIEIGVPPALRGPLLAVVPALVAAWALAGFYGAIAPAVIRRLSGSDALLLGGLGLFVLAGSAAAGVVALRNRKPRQVMQISAVALLSGMVVVTVALDASSFALFVIGTVIAGVGFGAGFQGAIRSVVPLAEPHQRAGLLSVVFVVSYLAMGVPAIVGGFLVVHAGGVLSTAREYAAAVGVLAALALVATLRSRVRSQAQPLTCPAQ